MLARPIGAWRRADGRQGRIRIDGPPTSTFPTASDMIQHPIIASNGVGSVGHITEILRRNTELRRVVHDLAEGATQSVRRRTPLTRPLVLEVEVRDYLPHGCVIVVPDDRRLRPFRELVITPSCQ